MTDPMQLPTIDAADARTDTAFRVVSDTAYLYFAPGTSRPDRLIVSFDNLATIDNPYPRLPWLCRYVTELGYSLLGVQSHAKDWFRQARAPALIRQLSDQGFFTPFSRVTFTGASMGGFAAINFAPLVHGAAVLAFSPQSTMNRKIAPFEARFPWAVKNSNWEGMPFLDAAAAIPYLPHASIFFDPHVPQDRAHAARLAAPHVQMLRLPHASHEAVRLVVKLGRMAETLSDFTEHGRIGPSFWKDFRGRREQRKWCRALIDAGKERHPKLTFRAASVMLQNKDYLFARRAKTAILAEHPELDQPG